MASGIGRFDVIAYSDHEEIDRSGPYFIFSAADKAAKDSSMFFGQTCYVVVREYKSGSLDLQMPEIVRVYRRARQVSIKDYI